jgi:hypothetical protein
MPFGLGRRKAQPTVDRQRQVDLGYVASRLAEGDLSLVAGCSTDSSVTLTLHNISLVESRVARADGGGIREKIARGLYFYVTQPQSAEPVEELVELDRGTVTITIEGIAFAGKSRHIGVGFGAIESISHSQNGMAISTRNGAQRIHFEGADRVIIPLKVHDREYSQHLSGKLMRLLLEAVIKISFDDGRAGA